MTEELLTAQEAARRLGISVATFYDWLGQSDRGLLIIRGQTATINYYQGGAKGQGRIHIEPNEVERIRDLMRVHAQPNQTRRRPIKSQGFPGITVPLGRPEN